MCVQCKRGTVQRSSEKGNVGSCQQCSTPQWLSNEKQACKLFLEGGEAGKEHVSVRAYSDALKAIACSDSDQITCEDLLSSDSFDLQYNDYHVVTSVGRPWPCQKNNLILAQLEQLRIETLFNHRFLDKFHILYYLTFCISPLTFNLIVAVSFNYWIFVHFGFDSSSASHSIPACWSCDKHMSRNIVSSDTSTHTRSLVSQWCTQKNPSRPSSFSVIVRPGNEANIHVRKLYLHFQHI